MSTRTERSRHLSLVPDSAVDLDAVLRSAPRTSVVNYVVRVELNEVSPTVWRRVRIRSDLLLPELHDVLQLVMGWQNRHLHAFEVLGGDGRGRYEMQYSLDENGYGSATSEDHIRVGDLLVAPGDRLVYEYDFGDGWEHTVRLETVDEDVDDLRTVCLGGERACPLEDCGGPGGYERLLDALADPADEEHDALAEWAGPFDPDAFDVASANMALRSAAHNRTLLVESVAASAVVARLFAEVQPPAVGRLMTLLPRCELTIESSIDLPVASIAMVKLTWFLRAVGERGITLTGAGYIPPAVVERMRDDLDWGLGWIGTSTREIDNHQVSDLRDSVRILGLTRVLKGKLSLTKLGAQLVEDPVALWRHCASRLPLGREDYEKDAGTLFLISLAASASAEERNAMIAETLHALGWGNAVSTSFDAQIAAQPTVRFLDLIGAHGPTFYFRSDLSKAPGWSRRFARDALRT